MFVYFKIDPKTLTILDVVTTSVELTAFNTRETSAVNGKPFLVQATVWRAELQEGQRLGAPVDSYDGETAVREYPAEMIPPPPPVRDILPLAFKLRLTKAERKALRAAARQNEDLEDFLDLLDSAVSVNLDDPLTVAGVDAFVAAGVVTQARAEEILA